LRLGRRGAVCRTPAWSFYIFHRKRSLKGWPNRPSPIPVAASMESISLRSSGPASHHSKQKAATNNTNNKKNTKKVRAEVAHAPFPLPMCILREMGHRLTGNPTLGRVVRTAQIGRLTGIYFRECSRCRRTGAMGPAVFIGRPLTQRPAGPAGQGFVCPAIPFGV